MSPIAPYGPEGEIVTAFNRLGEAADYRMAADGPGLARILFRGAVIAEYDVRAVWRAIMNGPQALEDLVKGAIRTHQQEQRLPAQQHRRMAAAALNRRRHLIAPIRERRGTL